MYSTTDAVYPEFGRVVADHMKERSKMRIISTATGAVATNPFLLSREEEKEVAKKKVDFEGGLTIPRR